MQMSKRQLANGAITVWMDGEQRVIHHANGLTIALTEGEAFALKQWLDEQDTLWEERAEFLNLQRMEQEDEEQEQLHLPDETACRAEWRRK